VDCHVIAVEHTMAAAAWGGGDGAGDFRRPSNRRLTLAPMTAEEVLVEEVDDDESSDSDESCGQGAL
jgi:hypothetical protein